MPPLEYELRIQDPTDPPQSLLLDIVQTLVREGEVVGGDWFFGFVTGSGIQALMANRDIAKVLYSAAITVLVGLDAVTDRAGLTGLQNIESRNSNFHAKVILNTTGNLVHPKLLQLTYASTNGALIVGSNNLTGTGLSGNIEAYAILRYTADQAPDLRDWTGFVERWAGLISPITSVAFERAAQNEARLRAQTRAARRASARAKLVLADGHVLDVSHSTPAVTEPMLIALIPRAGGRWPQVHYTKQIISDYFKAAAGDEITLHRLGTDESEQRPIIYAPTNKNFKIELGAAAERERQGGYPEEGPPLVLMRREGRRQHRYLFLLPGDAGYEELATLATSRFSGPTRQLPRVTVARSDLLTAWPDCPL